MTPGKTGIARIIAATGHSVNGIKTLNTSKCFRIAMLVELTILSEKRGGTFDKVSEESTVGLSRHILELFAIIECTCTSKDSESAYES